MIPSKERGECGQALLPVYAFKSIWIAFAGSQVESGHRQSVENRLNKQARFILVPSVGIALVWRHKEFSLFEALEDGFNSFVLGGGLSDKYWLVSDVCREPILLPLSAGLGGRSGQ
jgi:hypothetical protein